MPWLRFDTCPAAHRSALPAQVPRRKSLLLRDVKTRARSRGSEGADDVDLYVVLNLPKSATDKDIKTAYRRLQKIHHPDQTGGSKDMSALLNRAHDTLIDRNRRIQYDGLQRRAGRSTGTGFQNPEGVVGPLKERAVVVADMDIRVQSCEAAVDWLQQWGSTFAFGCELPFSMPLQCDPLPQGVRIAFISVSSGQIVSVGELLLEVDENALLEDGVARVSVTRVSKNPDNRLPGEDRVLKTLQHALRSKMNRKDGFQLGGVLAAISGLGLLPLFNFGNQDTSYDAYQIPKRCDVARGDPSTH